VVASSHWSQPPTIAWHDLADSFVPNGVVKSAWLTVLLGVGAIGTYDWWDGPRLLDDLTDWYAEALSRNTLPEDAADAFDERSISSTLEDLDTPTLSIHGLDDTLFGPPQGLRTYRGLQERGVESRLLLYGGGHTLSELTVPLDSRSYMTRQTLDWMDRHLRGADADVPQVGTSLQQRGEWRTNEQFPPADVSRTGLAFDVAERVGDNTVKRKSLLWDSWVTYHWERPTDVEVVGAPELELSLDVYGPEARLFVRFLQDGTPINGVRGTARVDGPGHQQITLSYPSLQRFVAGGETIGLQVSVTDSLHSDSRFSDGVTIYEAESVARFPTRPQ